MSIYQWIRSQGWPIDSYRSDLYTLPPDSTAWICLRLECRERGLTMPNAYPSPLDGKVWADLPFMFDPFWEKSADVPTLPPSK